MVYYAEEIDPDKPNLYSSVECRQSVEKKSSSCYRGLD